MTLRPERPGLPARLPLWLFCLGLLALCVPPARAADKDNGPPAWKPEKTWVFAISSTEWKYDHNLNMPKKGRHDLDLMDVFKSRGVPAEQIVFLKDKQGTLAEIRTKFVELLRKTQKGDTLIFYFQGHGGRDIVGNQSNYYFVNYDARGNDGDTYLYTKAVYDMIEANFKGSQVLLTADCCCSGGLAFEARKRKTNIPYAVLTSVFAHNGSTGAWTYTEGLIKGFKGEAVMDANGDGVVTLKEMADQIREEMAFAEEQMIAYQTFNGFDDRLQMATAPKKKTAEIGKFIEAKQDGKWYAAQIVDYQEKSKKYQVAYMGYNEREWVTADRTREPQPVQYKEGTKVLVKTEDGKWEPATVKKALYGLHLVHYESDKSGNGNLNEWVRPDEIKPK